MKMTTKLKRMRKQTGMSQTDFALFIGVPFRTYQDWEIGNRKPSAAAIQLIGLLLEDVKEVSK